MVWAPTLPGTISRASLAMRPALVPCLVVSACPDGLAPAAGHWPWKLGENRGVVVLRAGAAMTPGHGQALCCPCPSPLVRGWVPVSTGIFAMFAVTRNSPPRAGAHIAGHPAHGARSGSDRQALAVGCHLLQAEAKTVRCRPLIWEVSPGTGSSEVW